MAPPPPRTDVEWAKLGLSVNDSVNGHIEAIFTTSNDSWSTPNFVTDPYLRLHGLCPGLNYGMQAYEGLKACRTPDNRITIFRPQFHCKRMAHSAETVSMPAVPEQLFMDCITEAVRRNAEFIGPADTNAVLYIRPILFGSGPQLALEPPSQFTFAVYVQPATTYHGVQPLPCGIMEQFDRTATRGTGHAKIGGNYAPVMRWSREAKQKGFYLTLHLDSATQSEIDEFSTSGFVGVKKAKDGEKATIVVPDSKQVIDSVTSDTLQQLAKKMGYQVEKRVIKYDELGSFSEVLAVGTAASVLPIMMIVRESTGDRFVYCVGPEGKPGPGAQPGPAAVELGQKIKDVIRGAAKDEFGWLYEVEFTEEKPKKLGLVTNGPLKGLQEEELAMVTSPI